MTQIEPPGASDGSVPPAYAGPRTTLTLLDLVAAIHATGASENEVVAAIVDLIATGRVRIIGAFGGFSNRI